MTTKSPQLAAYERSDVCALPASDHRSCGDAGTMRKAYLHEGWRLTIHCASAPQLMQ